MSVQLVSEVKNDIASAIQEAGGAEVFFGASVDSQGRITGTEVLARGDSEEVPAMLATVEMWDLVIHNHPGGDLRPSKPDLNIAAQLGAEGKGFAIVDNEAKRMYVVVEPPLPEERVAVERRDLEAFFAPGGPLSKTLNTFESRGGQLDMALAVADAFNSEKVCAVEAGTGSGKSFAYLVPAVMFAKANRARVVVTTGTINLQEQLIGKDLPALIRAFRLFWGDEEDVPFHYSHMKGRGNYLCKMRTNEFASDSVQLSLTAQDNEEQRGLQRVVEWSRNTEKGSFSDLPFGVSSDVWDQVNSQADRCMGVKCPEFRNCFYFRARFRANRSQILVANHHLFFADFSIRRETGNFSKTFVLPPWQHVIFDEAHELEGAASSFFGVNLTQRGMLRRLGRLQSEKNPNRGTVPALCEKLMRAGESSVVAEIQGKVLPGIKSTRERVAGFFREITEKIGTSLQAGRGGGNGEQKSLRYRGEREPWDELFRACRRLAGDIKELKGSTKEVLDFLREQIVEDESIEAAVGGLNSVYRRLERFEQEILTFSNQEDTEQVRWVEFKTFRGNPYLVCRSAPLSIGPGLKEALWSVVPTCVLTSATLSTEGKVDFLAGRLGLSGLGKERFNFVLIPSPFKWKDQAVFMVPTDIAEVNSSGFMEDLSDWIVNALQVSRGRAFILFTSYRMLKKAYSATKDRLKELGLDTFYQGHLPRGLLLEEFKKSGRAVLFGTDCFWQGVDVRGEALSCVLIARLPFAVPTDPLQVARMEKVKEEGGNPFREFSLPQAVLKLRQGLGRLIRSHTDRGALVVLDRRIATKSYGKVFLRSLPPFHVELGDGRNLLEVLRNFLETGGREEDVSNQAADS